MRYREVIEWHPLARSYYSFSERFICDGRKDKEKKRVISFDSAGLRHQNDVV